MKITITIECDNAAFGRDPLTEVSRILRQQLADPMRASAFTRPHDFDGCKLRDINGNTVGLVSVTED